MYEVHCEYGCVASFNTSVEAHTFAEKENAKDGEDAYWVLYVSQLRD